MSLARHALPRPLLFQASALQTRTVLDPRAVDPRAAEPRAAAISAPALGRVDPVTVLEADGLPEAAPVIVESSRAELSAETAPEISSESFWPLVRLEATEAGLLLVLNTVLALVASWLAGVAVYRLYGELWHFLVPVHFAISWAFEMVPITLVGQSPLMGSLGLLLDSAQPERRIAFSLFHLISVLLFPVSFFCMVLTPYHRTLAEILTGQEILSRPLPRMR